MASFVNQVTFGSGTVPGGGFSASGFYGDWQTFHIPFQPFMPSAAQGKIRVIASASGDGVPDSYHLAPTSSYR